MDPHPPHRSEPEAEVVEPSHPSPLRILLVEDEQDHADLVAAYLAEADGLMVDLVHAPRVGRAVELLEGAERPFHVVLCDQRLPDSEYWETVERVASVARDTPVVALTSIGDEDMALDAMRQGAQDYLIKSELSPDLLRRALRYAVERAHQTGTLRSANEALRQAEAEVTRRAQELHVLNQSLEERVREQTDRVRALSAQLAAAEQEERQRIAHLLHDDLQQHLHALSITLTLFVRASTDEERAPIAERAHQTLERATTLTRTLATELSPAVLQTERLGDVLRWLAERSRETFGLEVDVQGEASVPDSSLRVLLYHVVREVLFNVAKHAGTNRARVSLVESEDGVTVRVEDEGAGFDAPAPDESASGGFGLASVRERLAVIGGRVGIQSARGEGTRVTLSVPLEPAA